MDMQSSLIWSWHVLKFQLHPVRMYSHMSIKWLLFLNIRILWLLPVFPFSNMSGCVHRDPGIKDPWISLDQQLFPLSHPPSRAFFFFFLNLSPLFTLKGAIIAYQFLQLFSWAESSGNMKVRKSCWRHFQITQPLWRSQPGVRLRNWGDAIHNHSY